MYAMNTSLELTTEDVGLLRDVIRSYLDDLRSEIVHTENYDYRQTLHERQRRLNEILAQLGGS